MKASEQRVTLLVCTRCGVGVELCAFCDREACRHPICYRCLRGELHESMAHPHAHGG